MPTSRPNTTAYDIERFINNRIDYGPISLTDIFDIVRPVHLIALGYDEIAFVYADGSRYTTALTSDDEYIEFESLRYTLEAGR